jgi:indolepyruvate ferredoxin oxidoreductase beta subunit
MSNEINASIVLAGVGGQGTLIAGKLLGILAMNLGLDVKVSEVHGMSQRGGSVVTYVKIAPEVHSPIIEEGTADYVLSFEEVESVRWGKLLKKGGTMIVIGACNEGLGSARFEEWLTGAPTAHSMVERIGKDFQLGGHKAAAIAMVLENARIDLVSEMEDDFVRSIFLNPQPDAQTAFDEAMARYGDQATVIAMPFGGATLPMPPA